MTNATDYTPVKKLIKKERLAEPKPLNVHEASSLEQAMAEIGTDTDKGLKSLILQKYGVLPVQLTEEEQAQCQIQ